MLKELSKEELRKIYEGLSRDLKDAISSEDTADAIWNICKLHDVEKTSDVAKIVGQILMGLLPPDILIQTLQNEMGLSEDIAKKVGMEIEHFIFNSVKNELDALYEKGENKEEPTEKEAEESEKPDTYREPIE